MTRAILQLTLEQAMGWVNDARQELEAGRHVQVRPVGGSMRGRIESGQLVTLAPVEPSEVQLDDVVLIRWRGNYLLHIVKEIDREELLIGNNLGKVNGWAPKSAVLGKVIAVQRDAPESDTEKDQDSWRHPPNDGT